MRITHIFCRNLKYAQLFVKDCSRIPVHSMQMHKNSCKLTVRYISLSLFTYICVIFNIIYVFNYKHVSNFRCFHESMKQNLLNSYSDEKCRWGAEKYLKSLHLKRRLAGGVRGQSQCFPLCHLFVCEWMSNSASHHGKHKYDGKDPRMNDGGMVPWHFINYSLNLLNAFLSRASGSIWHGLDWKCTL